MQHTKNFSANFKLYLIITLTIIFWGSAYVGIRAGLQGYTPGSLALFRFFIASICMLIFYLKGKQPTKLAPGQILQIAFLGIIGFTIYHVALNFGELTVSAAVASFVISQVPVLITLFAMIFLNEQLTKIGWLGTGVSFTGLLVISFGGKGTIHFDHGIIFVFIAAIAGCFYTILQKPLLKKVHPINFLSYAIWAGTAFLLIFLPNLIQEIPKAPLTATLAVIYIGVFPGAIAYLLWSYALKQLPASKLGSTLYIAPLCTMFLGWIFLDEIPTLLAISGGLLALIGAYLVNRGVKKTING